MDSEADEEREEGKDEIREKGDANEGEEEEEEEEEAEAEGSDEAKRRTPSSGCVAERRMGKGSLTGPGCESSPDPTEVGRRGSEEKAERGMGWYVDGGDVT